MLRMGRWLAAEHPEVQEPGQWTRELCAAWVAAVDRLRIGDYIQAGDSLQDRIGEPLMPRTKAGLLAGARQFFRDCQEWGWIPRRFDPARALATPRSISALIGPDPRVIADDAWAKLLWAGLNLEQSDVYDSPAGRKHPIELLRALALVWLFGGLRSDEIVRLRTGCIRWQHDTRPAEASPESGGKAVCLLDIPVHKTGTAFTKPVDPILGQAVAAWEAVRPVQPAVLDRKTSERVHLLFSYRAQGIGHRYLNDRIIPALCAKAGVPTSDVRGKITSHRARSTIATQLYNAKEPMTLFELQAWLGHGSPNSTQQYAKITPATLTRAYQDAGYFERNVRTIEVLIDRDAVAADQAAAGEPWQYYDLGHGLCSYTFFEQCPHRMACAKCDFYTPKNSSKAQLLEAKDNLQRMLAAVPSPTTSEPPSTTARPHSTSSSGSSPTSPRLRGPRPARSEFRRRRPRCRSWRSPGDGQGDE
jgi:integrase